ncbi:carbon-nitrogen hydrolase family protein [uncultured Erythrobacter sp.]|uniref:carbon-nitrogen hydrolase family protein n=1 Tax=uncultured Erythrobacter sp. TaxID=263913 RepID=UPI002633D864|nr:carbon-nitrogen hydrolase family protein [uncultured Erythrobacter sp.]
MRKIAVLQMTSVIDPEVNFRAIQEALKEAQAANADILFTPEMSLLLDRNRKRAAEAMASPTYSEYRGRLHDLVRTGDTDLALGSMPVPLPEGKNANRSLYFFAGSREPVKYDKMHMFDVDLATGESWRESNAYAAGEDVVSVEDARLGRLGLSVCYDLRFPALFEALGQRQCDAIAVPAAFTKPTGEAHWHILLRARAIEASAFVIAAAQVGKHEDGRETYGHSLVVDPWGEVLLDMGGEQPGLGFCNIDLERIAEVRAQIPSLANRRKIPN